ncbi:HD domain-containing protein [Botrimarina sp.]|uniref:[protein-PII] uridylyltransferase family protein n=1 Tax=Botrimarina sp. TaxID=2795802 RepID=UPI0032EBF426
MKPSATGGESLPSGPRLPQHVARARADLAEARRDIRESHRRGLEPIRVGARLSAAADIAVGALWEAALADLPAASSSALAGGCALVAHGGYGRRQLAPLSDIDLMILYAPSAKAPARDLSRRLTGELFDLGMEVGHSLRTVDEALTLARRDAVVATSLLESRRLFGSQDLYERFAETFRAATQRRGPSACAEFVAARREERRRYGETVYLLEPNIKRSRGALRDIHLTRWLWFVQHGVTDLDRLRSLGAVSKMDHHRLTSARDFLLRVRNELHYGADVGGADVGGADVGGADAGADRPPPAGRPRRGGDALHRHEQLRIADVLGYRDGDGIRPVERFMRDYFRHAGFVWFLASRLSELTTRRRSVVRALEPVLAKSIASDYRVGFGEISATETGKQKLARDTAEPLRLLDLARDHGKRIAQDTWYAVYRTAYNLPSDLSVEAARRFVAAMTRREGLPQYLRRAHDLTILEKVLPPFRDVRCLLQFNQYHKFTVDEHSLRAVQAAVQFADRDDRLGAVCRAVKDPAVLHLALLLHDVGKARPGDHSVAGEQIAIETGRRLGLGEQRTATLALLVRHHLRMSHLAFRRDTTQPALVREFAELVATPDTLGTLLVLTCADMAAVGPGVLNDWKVGVLEDLYRRTYDRLTDNTLRIEDRRNAVRTSVWKQLTAEERDRSELKDLFQSLPESFLLSRSATALTGALRRMGRVATAAPPPTGGVGRPGVDAWGGYHRDETTLEMVAAVADGAGRGVFSSMAGALSAKGLRILSAETALLAHGVLLLRYTADDPTPAANAAEANRRVQAVATAMAYSVDSDEPPRLPTVWGAERQAAEAALSGMPNEVRIDTSLSDDSAIVEVFTIDRPGLLYRLARTLHEVGLVIRFAKIATSLDQVVDVFYVTTRDGDKPTDDDQLAEVRRRLMAVIDGES